MGAGSFTDSRGTGYKNRTKHIHPILAGLLKPIRCTLSPADRGQLTLFSSFNMKGREPVFQPLFELLYRRLVTAYLLKILWRITRRP